MLLFGQNAELVVRIRHKTFFDAVGKKVDEIAAADKRRHVVAHISKFISLRDMIEQVTNECSKGTLIPSETTVPFAFTKKNAFVNTAVI